MRLVWGTVEEILSERPGLQTMEVSLPDGSGGSALCYTKLAGACAAGDSVLLNTTAVDLDLGTGGQHFVVARGGEGVALHEPSGGHIMKLRYTPLQVDVASAEEQSSSHHVLLKDADDVSGMPVVCCGLHSQVPLVAAAVKAVEPELKVAYVMTDEAAVPMALSRTVVACRQAGFLDATVSCGQAFGGELEAVTLHSGLLSAKHVAGAGVAVVAIGPGVVGTGTRFGHAGVAQGEAVNAAAVIGGRPVAVLRLSFADARPRHQVLSHHSITALTRVALARCTVAVPELQPALASRLAEALTASGVGARHDLIPSSAESAAACVQAGIELSTMGRRPEDDPAFFSAASAAGDVAGRMAAGSL